VALRLAGRVSDLESGVELARQALDRGEPLRRLERWATLSHEPVG
jgi:anthranilate phosphoribosyltransferase